MLLPLTLPAAAPPLLSQQVQPGELYTLLNALGFQVKHKDVEKMISLIDGDGSGTISFDDFSRLVKVGGFCVCQRPCMGTTATTRSQTRAPALTHTQCTLHGLPRWTNPSLVA